MLYRIKKLFILLAVTFSVMAIMTAALATERYEVLALGDKDEYVLRLQKELASRGYLKVEPTGYFGVETQKALIRYQERNDIGADGKAGPLTLKKIYGKNYQSMPSTRKVSEIKDDSPVKGDKDKTDILSYRLGDEGPEVSKMQKKLKELGYYKYNKITTYYGAITEDAVIAFQKQNGLTSDGVAGKRTTNALYSKNAKKASASSNKQQTSSQGANKVKEQAVSQSSAGKTQADKAIEIAQKQMGKRYRTGAKGPNTFDCSGFIYYVLRSMGVSTPRSSSEMGNHEKWPKVEGTKNLKKGDLVFFTPTNTRNGIGHVGMYLGGSKFIHCSSGSAKSVTVSSLSSDHYKARYLYARRCFK